MAYSWHVMASVRGIQIAEALLTLCLVYYVMKLVQHCWNRGIMAFTYRDLGRAFHKYILGIFCNDWQRYFLCCSLLIMLCNGQNIAKYEAYWLISVPIINPWGAGQPFFLAKRYAQINQPKLLCFQKVNKLYKEKSVILQAIGII